MSDSITDMLENPGRPSYSEIAHENVQLKAKLIAATKDRLHKKPITSAACYAALYQQLALVARDHGYALTIHGSMTRDFDLVAVPWVETASDDLMLITAIKKLCGGVFHAEGWDDLDPTGNPTKKPHGRKSWSIHLTNDGMYGPYLDISVMPRASAIRD